MAQDRPNILLVVMDCARSDRWHGPVKTARTPVFDRLAGEGVVLPTTITETAATTPCFAGLLTGAYSFRHGVHSVGGYRAAAELPTLAECLRSAGYHTYAEVTGPLLPVAGLDRGFDEYNYRVAFDFLHTRWGEEFLARLAGGGFSEPWFILLHLWELHVVRQVLPAFDTPEFGTNTYDRALSSLDARLGRLIGAAGEGVVTILTGDHGEKTVDETYQPGTAVDRARTATAHLSTKGLGVRAAAMMIGPAAMYQLRARFQPRLEATSLLQACASLRCGRANSWGDFLRLARLAPSLGLRDLFAMRAPGMLTKVLARRGALDADRNRERVEMLVERVGEQRMFELYLRMWITQFRKQLNEGHVLHVYDFLTRVPLLMHAPRLLPARTQHNRMVRQIDIAISLLELLGVPAPGEFSPDGRSFAPLVHGHAWRAKPAFLSVSGQPPELTLRGVRTETHKLVYGPNSDDTPVELYDLAGDPRERRNTAAQEPQLCEKIRALAEGMCAEAVTARPADLSDADAREMELRLRELGYVE